MAKLDRQKFESLVTQHKAGFIVGLQDVAGIKPRLDIDVLLKRHSKTFNLFLQALQRLKDMKKSDIMSYYQIAGIHGFPKVLWNGVSGKLMKENVDWGYCAHGTSAFPTWHRPYLVMLEQALFIEMINVVDQYNDASVRSEYETAALEFRLPYWDYYRPRGGAVTFPGIVDEGQTTAYAYDYKLPEIFTVSKVMIRAPGKNELVEIDNPLQHFNFGEMAAENSEMKWNILDKKEGSVLNRNQTSRHPWKETSKSSYQWDNFERLNKTLNELRMDANRIVLDMIGDNYYKQYDQFATAGRSRPAPKDLVNDKHKQAISWSWGGSSGNLEGLHGLYHGLIGGMGPGGHMSRVATAAFDPVFWMHHCQIERIFTLWQAAHADDGQSNWFSSADRAKDDLLPFARPTNKDNEKYWKSNSVKSEDVFGYRFEDVKSTPDETRRNFEDMYRWSVPLGRTDKGARPPQGTDMEPLDLSDSEFWVKESKSVPVALQTQKVMKTLPQSLAVRAQAPELAEIHIESLTDKNTYWEWYIDDEVDRLALDGSFSIMYFINLESGVRFDDEQDWSLAPTLAGLTYIFAAPKEGCDNCGRQAEQYTKVNNTVPITSQLLDFVTIGSLASMDRDRVGPFLQDRLKWRIMTVNGDIVNPRLMSEMHGLKIGLSYKLTRGSAALESGRADEVIDNIVMNAAHNAGRAGTFPSASS